MTDRFAFPNFEEALSKMGAKLISERLEYIEIGEAQVVFDAKGLLKGVVIPPQDIQNLETRTEDELFCYEGNQVILYIDQPYKSREDLVDDPLVHSPKYHLKRCLTLVNMDNKGRYESRYIMTNNTSGHYDLIPYDHFNRMHLAEEQFEAWVPVCRNCLKSVNYMNYSYIYSQSDKDAFVRNFDLRKFFDHFGPYFERRDYERLNRPSRAAGSRFQRDADTPHDAGGGDTHDAEPGEEHTAPAPETEDAARSSDAGGSFTCGSTDCGVDLSSRTDLYDQDSRLCLLCREDAELSPMQEAAIKILRLRQRRMT